ncbi:MAG TPA: hypothetical protein VEU33_40410 [Archangium sp.]|nr:hypothetical protein [Archangium sp.]
MPRRTCSGPPSSIRPRCWERYRAWAGDGIFRLSIGLEAPEDLIRDLDQALTP